MEIDVRDQLPGAVDAIRFADTVAMYSNGSTNRVELRVDGQAPGSGLILLKTDLNGLARAITAAQRIWG